LSAFSLLVLNSQVRGEAWSEDVRWSLQALPERIDNLEWRTLDRWYLINQLFDRLIVFDANHNIRSGAATRWTISQDRTEYTFFLREDLKFSNGRKIGASDVVFSLKRYLMRQDGSNLLREAIKGASSLKTVSDDIEGLKAIDEHTVQISLKYPFEMIWMYLSLPMNAGIVARESVDPETLRMKAEVVSSGPYQIKMQSKDHYRLVRNPYYRSNDPKKVQSIGFYRHNDYDEALAWFKEGKTNFFSILDPFQTKDLENLLKRENISFPYHRVGLIYLNSSHENLKKIENRAQIEATLNAVTLEQSYENPLLSWSNSFFPPASPGSLHRSKLNVSQAFSNSLPNKKKSLQVLLEKGMPNEEIKRVLRERLAIVGIDVKFEYAEKDQMVQRFTEGNFEAAYLTFGLPIEDFGYGVYLYFIEEPKYLEDPGQVIHSLFNRLRSEEDPLRRRSLLQEVGKKIHVEKLIIPIFHTGVRYVLGDDLVLKDSHLYRTDISFTDLERKNAE
jgi:ABC-type transport system substrate-binding protein